ncbi:MAG: DUF2807 domain-containing protein [Flavobacterium sp.]|nr:DUF2807 domain-containing protein [Candidatus Neoflavobacterium equi]
MRKIYLLLLLALATTSIYAQKKEKIKGSKIVTVTQKEVEPFENLEILDNLEIFIVKGDKQGLEIEADDNLHDALTASISGNTLTLSALKEVSGAKKFSIRLTYTSDLKLITVKNDAQLNALMTLTADNVTVKNFDNSRSYLNVDAPVFTLIMTDKSKGELNVKSKSTTLNLSKSVSLKALVQAEDLKVDLYQKATTTLEGDTQQARYRLDNNSSLTAKKMTTIQAEIATEGYASASVQATESLKISASGKSEIQIYGTPKMELTEFRDTATLYKKQ